MNMRQRSGTGRIRLAEVAAHAGVSTMTVSRALNRPELLSEAVRARVEASVRAVGYTPDLVASSLASNRTGIIAAIVPTLANSVISETIDGVQDVLTRAGYHLILANSHYAPETEEVILSALIGRRPDGVMTVGITHTARTRQLLKAAALPVVEMWDLTKTPIDAVVGFSNFDAASAMVGLLNAAGYRRIAHVNSTEGDAARAASRRQGYEAALGQFGLGAPFTLTLPGPPGYANGARAVAELHPGFDAAFFSDDVMAAGALLECQARGLRVPRDLAIAGFGDNELSSRLSPDLTTVRVARYDIGRRAAELLMTRLAGDRVDPSVVDLGFELIRRGST
jgi:LacI family gluconate utilization system Gnt-I transcriptional repressor